MAGSTKELADRRLKFALLEAKIDDYRVDLLEIAGSITRERANLKAADSTEKSTARKQAIDAIHVTFEQHKTRESAIL